MEQRYNIFNLIHKALRHMLYDTALKIQRTDFSSVEETTPVLTQLEQILLFFEDHAVHEDSFILPVVAKHDARIVHEFQSEHEEDHRLTEDLRAFITQWNLEKHSKPRVLWGEKIFYSFNKFVAFNLNHTNKEERLLNHVLWNHYSDGELQNISQKIIQSIKPDILITESRWMMRSISRAELISWLEAIKQTAPSEVFKVFMQLAQQELPEARWREVNTKLFKESTMV